LERYDRELRDVFEVQDEIAAAIADALKLKLAPSADRAVHRPSVPAYEAFLRGRHYLLQSSPEAFARAKTYFEQALALDPKFAAPRAELAYHSMLLATQGLAPAREFIPAARELALRALELDPSEPRAHLTLCAIATAYDYDWAQAAKHFRMALAAEAVPPEVRLRAALFYLFPLGRFEEAVRHFQMMVEQDPLNALFRSAFAWVLAFGGQPQRALEEIEKAKEINSDLWMSYFPASLAYVILEKYADAREAIERAMQFAPWNPFVPGLAAGILVRCDRKQEAETLLAERKHISAIGMLYYHFVSGNIDAALDSYAVAIEQRDPMALFFAGALWMKPLREHPRWTELARAMNLPDALATSSQV
jgi:tetratricopeptide (TPR) repeat protein